MEQMSLGPKKEHVEHTLEEKEKQAFSEFLNTIIFKEPYMEDPVDKEALFKKIQQEWYYWAEKNSLTQIKKETESTKEYLQSMCASLSKQKPGHADTPKMIDLLPESQNGLSCLSSALVLSSILEKQKIPYSFLNPVGHVVLEVDDQEKKYYVDARNNQVIDMTPHLLRTEDYKEYDILHFTEKDQGKFYRYALRQKQNENELKSIFGNIIVLNHINQGDESGASPAIEFHRKTAVSLKPLLEKLDFTHIKNFKGTQYPGEDDYLQKLREDEGKRLQEAGFYNKRESL